MKEKKDTVRLNFDFPLTEYPNLKFICAMKGLSLRALATDLLLKAIEEAEDELLAKKANERLEALEEDGLITWEDAQKAAGWNEV